MLVERSLLTRISPAPEASAPRRALRAPAALCAVILACGCAATEDAGSGRLVVTELEGPPGKLTSSSGRSPCAPGPEPDQSDGWVETARADGVIASRRNQDGAELPVMKAVGRVEAGLYEVFAVIQDAARHTEWIYRCVESTVLERRSETEGILYNRVLGLPPIVADRDVVLLARASARRGAREILIEFESIETELKTAVDGVVRMPKMSGHYRLTAISESCTEIEYQVHADPGGWLFDWIKRAATRSLPLRTVLRLRRQVERTRGQYASFVEAWTRSL